MITHLRVKNYRSLADISLDLAPLTVLVGRNGSGKSSLIDVLWFVSDALRLGLDTAINKRLGINALRRYSSDSILFDQDAWQYDIEIQLEIKTTDFKGEYAFILASQSSGNYEIKAESCFIRTVGEQIGFETNEQKWVKQPAQMLPPIQATALILPLIAGIRPYKALHRFLTSMSFYNILPEQLREHQKVATPYPLEEDGQNLASVLLQAKRSNSAHDLLSAIRYVIPNVHDYQVISTGKRQIIQLFHHTKGEPCFELGQESEGTLRMLSILTALYQQPPRPLMALEEPELNIHPSAMAKLWGEIVAATKQSQLIITTHSPDLLDLCQADQLRIIEKIDGITHIGLLEEAQKQIIQANLFAPGQLLQAQGLHRAGKR